jgi:hypothetical protein
MKKVVSFIIIKNFRTARRLGACVFFINLKYELLVKKEAAEMKPVPDFGGKCYQHFPFCFVPALHDEIFSFLC